MNRDFRRYLIVAAVSAAVGALSTLGVVRVMQGAGTEEVKTSSPPVTLALDSAALERPGGGEMLISDPRLSLRDLKRVGDRLALSDPVAAVLRASEVPGVENRDVYLGEVLRTWGETDGESAAKWVSSQFSGEHLSDALYYVADGWAETDPEAAAGWFLENTTGSIRDDALWESVEAWGRKDTPAAVAWASQLDDYLKWMVMDGLASGWASVDAPSAAAAGLEMIDEDYGQEFVLTAVDHWADSSPEEAAAWVRGLENARLRANSSGELAKIWALGDPEAAAKWSAGIEDERSRYAALAGIADGWSRHDPAGAIEWALSSVEEPDLLEEMITDMTFNWSNIDPTGATNWLGKMEAGPHRDLVLQKFSNQVFEDDPHAAVGWAGEIGDPVIRLTEQRALLQRWLEVGGESARAQILRLDLPAELKSEFAKARTELQSEEVAPQG